ncbi:MAG: hypothetical protein M3256_25010 [Actinomycetota bacterium]|nr:hypothetical protein [Actinomycetota bacterium]
MAAFSTVSRPLSGWASHALKGNRNLARPGDLARWAHLLAPILGTAPIALPADELQTRSQA